MSTYTYRPRRPKDEPKERIAEYVEDARRSMPPGSTVYTTVKHVTRSGMQRSINVTTIEDNEPRWWSYRVAAILGWSFDDDREAVKADGAGMDMGFHLVYSLSSLLYPDGFGCTGKDCPSNDHSNGDRDYGRHTTRHKHWHRSGGYALRQRWM